MRLDEVLKLGKPFKRRGWIACYGSFELVSNTLTHSDVIADDWEYETQKIEITIFDLKAAFNEMLRDPYIDNNYRLELLAKELGFKE